MKLFLIGFIFLLLFSSNSFTQIDTTSLAYYPLNDGNYWEYFEEIRDYLADPPMFYYNYYSYEVIGDTIFPILGQFKIIEIKKLRSTSPSEYLFERIDTVSCNVYRYDTFRDTVFLIDSLKAMSGDSCNAGRFGYDFDVFKTYCTGFLVDTIFSIPVLSKDFNEPNILFYSEHQLTSGLGLTQSNVYPCFMSFITQLVYARINGIEYGSQVNLISLDNEPIVNKYQLYQNYPNPFNPITKIKFSLSSAESVTLKIFNLRGQEIVTLLSGKLNAGEHTFVWDASNVASGVYIIQLQTIQHTEIKKCLLIK